MYNYSNKMNIITTSDTDSVKDLFSAFIVPNRESHKGQNGKILIVGGSHYFHAASIWAAEVASHFVDMVHYASTPENNEILLSLKKVFRNGIVVRREDIDRYAEEDDAILVGPGMMREGPDGHETKLVSEHLLKRHPRKRFVLDAGTLQTIDAKILAQMKETAILTPHQGEFKTLFGIDLLPLSLEQKVVEVEEAARRYSCVILLKAIDDIVTDGTETFIVRGGNAGLTKGGTGDVLAGLAVALRAKHDALRSALYSSIILKRTAESLSLQSGNWYNVSDIIGNIAHTVASLV